MNNNSHSFYDHPYTSRPSRSRTWVINDQDERRSGNLLFAENPRPPTVPYQPQEYYDSGPLPIQTIYEDEEMPDDPQDEVMNDLIGNAWPMAGDEQEFVQPNEYQNPDSNNFDHDPEWHQEENRFRENESSSGQPPEVFSADRRRRDDLATFRAYDRSASLARGMDADSSSWYDNANDSSNPQVRHQPPEFVRPRGHQFAPPADFSTYPSQPPVTGGSSRRGVPPLVSLPEARQRLRGRGGFRRHRGRGGRGGRRGPGGFDGFGFGGQAPPPVSRNEMVPDSRRSFQAQITGSHASGQSMQANENTSMRSQHATGSMNLGGINGGTTGNYFD